ncbi:MAG: CoA transferase [SAR202 cluster bacterium]|nr:CoA transferase [SAR202 cluster bacterium]
MPGPLDGVKVVDFTEIIAGPLAGRLLADQGADVIKVEPPWGEPWRLTQRFTPTESRTFMTYNRGKRSLPLNLTKEGAAEIIKRLIPEMDIALVNFRPDVAAKLGVDYETLSAINPRLIYCELTAYGREGPDAHRPGYDMIVQAMTGMVASETKTLDGVPSWVWSSPLIDTSAGICMAWSVCAALYARERTGVGQKIETSLLASALSLMGARFLHVESLDAETREKTIKELESKRLDGASYDEMVAVSPGSRRREHHGNLYYRVYYTKDAPIGVGCLSDPLRRRLLDTLGLTDDGMEPGWDSTTPESQAYNRALEKTAEELLASKSSAEWLEIFEDRGIPAGPVRFIEELFDDPQVVANGLVTETEHIQEGKVKMMGPMAHFRGTVPEPPQASPALGQHAAEILEWLGFTQQEIDAWRNDGVIA